MLKNICAFYELANQALEMDSQCTLSRIKDAMSDLWFALGKMKFENPDDGQEVIMKRYEQIGKDLKERFDDFNN